MLRKASARQPVRFLGVSALVYAALRHGARPLDGPALRALALEALTGVAVASAVSPAGLFVAVPVVRSLADGKQPFAVEVGRVAAHVVLGASVLALSQGAVVVPAVVLGASSFALDRVIDSSTGALRLIHRARL